MRRWLVVILLVLTNCTSKSSKCGDKALLLWPDSGGTYVFQEVLLRTLGSLYRLKGTAAEIYYESGLDESGFTSAPAEPHLTNSGGVCVPEDVGSSLTVNAYAQFEHLYDFEIELGTDAQLTWPRRVGVEIHLEGEFMDIENNAHYYGQQDVITLVPYSLNDLPMSLNQGIVAHEHFHAHFQSQALSAMEKLNREKAGLLYDAIESRPDVFASPVDKDSRSFMNVVFTLKSEELEKEFLAEAKTLKMEGLKGHRSVGGMRASIYNAVPREGVAKLAELIKKFKA